MALTVVKVGGSLVANPARLRAILAHLAEGSEGPALIVPGGGLFADAVRKSQSQLGFDDATAHRLALDAMGQMAEVFQAIEPRLVLATSTATILDAHRECRCAVWSPAELRGGHPGLAESWDVTSDSLALWLATQLGAARCLLLKSAACPRGARPPTLADLGLVDRAFSLFAQQFCGTIVLRGPDGQDVSLARSNPSLHPDVRGEAEPPRRPPGIAAPSGGLLRGPLALASQDEGELAIEQGRLGAALR